MNEKQKPQLVVRKEGEVYVAEFNQDFFKDEMQPSYSGPNFQEYLTQSNQVEQGLELIASAAMPFRSYQVTKGEHITTKSDHVARRKNIARVHLAILGEAEKIAEQQGVPHFGLVVVAQSGDFPEKPTDADRDPFKEFYSSHRIEKHIPSKKYDKSLLKNLNELIPFKQTWTLHPTVNLYVPKGDGK